MAMISTEQKLENFRNMYGMIDDYKKLHSRFPTTKEFEEKLNMAPATVKRYKSVILKHLTEKLLEKYSCDMYIHIDKAMDALNEHSKICKEIRDKTSGDEKINANKGIVESELDIVRLIADSREYLRLVEDYNVSENGQEHNNKQIEKDERTQESIEAIFS